MNSVLFAMLKGFSVGQEAILFTTCTRTIYFFVVATPLEVLVSRKVQLASIELSGSDTCKKEGSCKAQHVCDVILAGTRLALPSRLA